jgi:LysR family glycine cleavage system transcriptional activator/LysR family transcriptional regulator of beta-lactamase
MAGSVRALKHLNGLRAFEVAARHGSFSKAALELNVTQAAVSRSVRELEKQLGISLFSRSVNRLMLTAQGEKLGVGLSARLNSIADLVTEVAASRVTRSLTVGVGSTFATRWLIPRLASFHEAHPEIEVRVAMGYRHDSFSEDWTCGIRFQKSNWNGYVVEPLFEADLVVVCAPAIAERLRTPSDLQRETILSVNGVPEDWATWLAAAKVASFGTGISFASHVMALQAALDGMGVAVTPLPYVSNDLRSGRLTTPFEVTIRNNRPWALIYKPFRQDSEELVEFRKWLLREAANPE